jgi:hypothetical protein
MYTSVNEEVIARVGDFVRETHAFEWEIESHSSYTERYSMETVKILEGLTTKEYLIAFLGREDIPTLNAVKYSGHDDIPAYSPGTHITSFMNESIGKEFSRMKGEGFKVYLKFEIHGRPFGIVSRSNRDLTRAESARVINMMTQLKREKYDDSYREIDYDHIAGRKGHVQFFQKKR